MILFLNGTSSAGKTTTAKKIQELYPEPILHMGIDHFFFSIDSRFVGEGKEAHLGYQFIKTYDASGPNIEISKGPFGQKLSQALHHVLKVIAEHRIPMIIDEVLFADSDFEEYLELFCKHHPLFFIALKPPKEVVVKREKQRGDRGLGLARGIYDTVYNDKVFDLEIDTSICTPEEAAKKILEHIYTHPSPIAFAKNFLQLQAMKS